MRKNYDLPQEIIDVLKEVMNKESIKYEKDALIYIVNEYNKRDYLVRSISDEIAKTFKNDFTRLRLGVRTAEHNSTILMDLANSFIQNNPEAIKWVMFNEGEMKSPQVKECEQHLAKKIARAKQVKDNSKVRIEEV